MKEKEKSVKGTGAGNRREIDWLQTREQDNGIEGLFKLGAKGTEGHKTTLGLLDGLGREAGLGT